jgi:4a-hydroxytetrahydrobiopterin dehydratase
LALIVPGRLTAMKTVPAKLTAREIETDLPRLPGWTIVDAKLHREYKFPDFASAFEFMKTAAPAIERMNHHPEWLNVYDRVVVDLTTHDAGGISQKDIDLAMVFETIAGKLE